MLCMVLGGAKVPQQGALPVARLSPKVMGCNHPHAPSTEPEARGPSEGQEAPYLRDCGSDGQIRLNQAEGLMFYRGAMVCPGGRPMTLNCCQQFIILVILLTTCLYFGPDFQVSDLISNPQVRTLGRMAGHPHAPSLLSHLSMVGEESRYQTARHQEPLPHFPHCLPSPHPAQHVSPLFPASSISRVSPPLSIITFLG